MRKLLVLLVFALIAPSCFAQGFAIVGQAQTNEGGFSAPIGGATITICLSTATGAPCTPAASIYSNLALSTAKANPFFADGNGNFIAYVVASAAYTVCQSSVTTQTFCYPVTPGGSLGCTVGGSPTNLQYNLSGACGGAAFNYLSGTITGPCPVVNNVIASTYCLQATDASNLTVASYGSEDADFVNTSTGFSSVIQANGMWAYGEPDLMGNACALQYEEIFCVAGGNTIFTAVNGTVTLGNNISQPGQLSIGDGSSGFCMITTSMNTCPGSGGSSPGGANTDVQFNNSGSFGGSANFTWNGTVLGITGAESITGQLTSTVTTGTAPFVIASTTNVPNLNASSLSGATFASPGPIGSGSASTGTFTVSTFNSLDCIEGTAPSAVSGKDIFYCDSTTHLPYVSANGAGFQQLRFGTVGVGVGGTSLTTLSANCVFLGEGTSTPHFACPASNGYVLTDNGPGSDPSFQVGPTGMSSSLDTVTAAMADATIGNGAYQERWNSTQTGSQNAFYLGEASAATGSGNIKLRVSTLSTSTAEPFRFDNNGNGIVMNDVGVVEKLASGYVDFQGALGNFPATCSGSFVRAILATPTCNPVSLTADVTGIGGFANGMTNTGNAPIKRILLRMAGCNAGSFAPSFDIPSSGGMTSNCKTDGTNGTVQGVMYANQSQISYASLVIPDDWTSFKSAKIWFTTADATTGHTIIFNVASACTAPNGGNVDTPAYNSANAFTTVTIGGGATANALYDTATSALSGTGCAAGDVLHLKFTRTTDTSTDTAIQLTGDMEVAYNGTYQ